MPTKLIIRHLCEYGGLAQLGERLPCTQEVGGSNPLASTSASVILSATKWREESPSSEGDPSLRSG